ncbi:MAG: hypothetical protein ACE5G2_01850, partial [Candidatus Krumholzibacteriia bacterium]
MNRAAVFGSAVVSATAALACAPTGAVAFWDVDGVPVSLATNDQNNPRIVSDGAAGAIVVWEDERAGSLDIYAQRITPAGVVATGWPADGVALCSAAGNQRNPRLVSDGVGGAIVVWEDFRSGPSDIYAQRVAGTGTVPPGWPRDGLPLCTATGHQLEPAIAPDGGGGGIVVWADHRDGFGDIYGQRVTPAGEMAAGWQTDGVAICAVENMQRRPVVVADGDGGAVVAWQDTRNDVAFDIYAQRITADGSIAPGWWGPGGVELCTAPGDQHDADIATDGAGGAIVTWHDLRGSSYDIYAQHVDSTGGIDFGWPSNGLPVCTRPGSQLNPVIVADDRGGVVVTWVDFRSGTHFDIYAQHLTGEGRFAAGWPFLGKPICTAAGDQRFPAIATDGAGGAIIAWYDARAGMDTDIYAQRVTAAGLLGACWHTHGFSLCTASDRQLRPALVADRAGGVIVTWEDHRGGTSSDIYAQSVSIVEAPGEEWPVNGAALSMAPGDQLPRS